MKRNIKSHFMADFLNSSFVRTLIQHHRHGRRQRNENKRPLARRMALAGALTADNRRKNDGYGHPKQHGIQVQLG